MNGFDQIEDYLSDKLAPEEQDAFLRKMTEDPELAKEVALQRFERSTIHLMVEDQLKNRIQNIQQALQAEKAESPKTAPKRIKLWRTISAVAASIALLLIAGYYISDAQYSNQAIVEANYEFSSLALRNTSSGSISELTKATKAMASSDYEGAIKILTPLLNVDSTAIQSRYLLGHAHLQLKDYAAASAAFKTTFESGAQAGPYQPQAQWYFLLAKLGLNEQDETFHRILAQLAPIDQRAEQLKKQLNSFGRQFWDVFS